MKNFFSDIVSEFHNITWPDRNLSIGHTILVITTCLVMGYYLGLFDGIFVRIINLFI